jgi:hypothetical protein
LRLSSTCLIQRGASLVQAGVGPPRLPAVRASARIYATRHDRCAFAWQKEETLLA